MKLNQIRVSALIVGVMTLVMSSCSVPKDVAYFQDTDTQAIIDAVNVQPIRVRPDDKLSIVVQARDAAVAALFNLPVYSTRIGTSNNSHNGTDAKIRTYTGQIADGIALYTVDAKGNIDFPELGTLHIEGMTRSEVAAFIKGELEGRELVKDPTVVVEFLNVGVNVLGDVKNPGRYDANKDNFTILDAIGLAGDLTITGERKTVKVLRQENGKLTAYTVDLTNAQKMAASPGFSLQQGDVVYVEPNTMQKRSTTTNGNNSLSVSFWISVGSLLTSVVTTLAVFIKR